MEKFQRVQPSSLLAPYVNQYWFISATDLKQGYQRAIPSGYTGLVFNRGAGIYTIAENTALPKAYMFGQTLSPATHTFYDSLDLIVVIFRPAGARAFFRMPMNEIFGANMPTDCFNDKKLTELTYQLLNCEDNLLCIHWIETYLSKQLLQIQNYTDRLNETANAIMKGERNISKLADHTHLGYKQFNRLFKAYIGLNPKEYMRIARCSSTLRRIQLNSNLCLDELAFDNGYYDKSHLIKEIKAFTGYTPSEFLSNSEPYSENKALFQSIFIDVKQ